MRRIVCWLTLVLLSSCAQASSLPAIPPLSGLSVVNVSVLVGGPMDVGGGVALKLFAGDVARARDFKASLTQKIAAELHGCGLSYDPNAEGEVAVGVYGHPLEEPGETLRYIYYIEISAFNPALPGSSDDPVTTSMIGAATDGRLEASLVDATVAILRRDVCKSTE